ncbi:MAG: type II secretion system F family protein [Myxococcales bacterium]|nr:type II secretion system F family protein [Myxococcales bacterium]
MAVATKAKRSARPTRPRLGTVETGKQLGVAALARIRRGSVPLPDLVFFTTQLAIMIETGSHLGLCLSALEEQTQNRTLRAALRRVRDEVQEGRMFSAALSRFPHIFDGVYVSMVRAGEAGAALDQMLGRLVEVLEKRENLSASFKSAMRYPMVLLAISGLVMIVLVTFLLPKFKSIFVGMGAVLPLPTRILMGLGDVVLGYWYLIAAALAGLALGASALYRLPVVRRQVDRQVLKLPGYGPLKTSVNNALILRLMGVLMDSGVPMLDAIRVARGASANTCYVELLDSVIERVSTGGGFASSLSETDLIPAITKQMIRTGESSGMLGRVLTKIADYNDRALDLKLQGLSKVIEPVMIVFMGGLVGFVAMSLLLPVFKLSTTVPH